MLRLATVKSELPRAARIRLLSTIPRLSAAQTQPADILVPLPGGPVFLGAESFYVDALTLGSIWTDVVFFADCRDRLVIDLGAHKGYFGAWALAHGAAFVFSCEPHSGNFDLLDRARKSNVRPSHWEAERVAVGETHGTAPLFVSSESWAHSMHEEMIESVSVEHVPMITLPEVLQRMASSHPDLDVVIKVNVEGSAGNILFPATADQLARVVEIHLDHEPGSPYDLDMLMKHLAAAGLDEVEQVRDKIYLIRRSH
jgi:FkbM family methyltransferase